MVLPGSGQHATAGDRVSGMFANAGAAALVTDGTLRDATGIEATGLPVWATGLSPASPVSNGPGRVGFPVQLGGQQVETGDMIVADRDGVVVVPFAQIDAVIAQIKAVMELEDALDAQISEGLVLPEEIANLLDSDETQITD